MNYFDLKTILCEIAITLSFVEFYFMMIALFVQKLHALKQTSVLHIFILTFNHLE